MNLKHLIERTGKHGLEIQNEDGSFEAGTNGPYGDIETSLRNTFHWLIIFCYLSKNYDDIQYKNAAKKCIEFIFLDKARPTNATFIMRNSKNKDKCNGLVGQAWAIESLVYAYETFKIKKCLELAKELYFLHPFDKKTGLWKRVEIDGMILSYDSTFNHQLWFASSASLLAKYEEKVLRDVTIFTKKILPHVDLYKDGIIYHASKMGSILNYLSYDLIKFISEIKTRFRRNFRYKELYNKSVGYHGFNLYAFALIERHIPGYIPKDLLTKIKKPLCNQNIFISEEAKLFGFFYNKTGPEFEFFNLVFNNKSDTDWIGLQLNLTYESDHKIFAKNSSDYNTSLARAYELIRVIECSK